MTEFEYPGFVPKDEDLPTALALLELVDWALVEGAAGTGVGLATGTPPGCNEGLEFMLSWGEEDWAMDSCCWGCCIE